MLTIEIMKNRLWNSLLIQLLKLSLQLLNLEPHGSLYRRPLALRKLAQQPLVHFQNFANCFTRTLSLLIKIHSFLRIHGRLYLLPSFRELEINFVHFPVSFGTVLPIILENTETRRWNYSRWAVKLMGFLVIMVWEAFVWDIRERSCREWRFRPWESSTRVSRE